MFVRMHPVNKFAALKILARLRALMSKLSTRLTLAMVFLVILTAVAIEYVTFRGIEIVVFPRAVDSIDTHVRLLGSEIDSYVDRARADVKSFRAAAALDGIVRAHRNSGQDLLDGTSEAVWRQRMAKQFAAELAAKPSYLQFRIIAADGGGQELVRVDRSGAGNAVRIVPDDKLQKKGARDYVRDTLALPAGAVYMSPIDLNREHGEIQRPYTPVLRVAIPIDTSDGARFGILIINLDMRPIFGRLRASAIAGGSVYVVNEHGDYLLNSGPGKEFGFEFGRRHRIQDDHPQFASLLKTDGVWNDTLTDPRGTEFAAAAVRLKFGPRAGIAVAEIVPFTTIMAPISSIRNAATLAGIGAAIAAAILATLLAQSLTRPLRQTTAAVQAFTRNAPMHLPTKAVGEIGVLVKAFKKLADEINSRSAALAGYAQRETLYAAAVQSSNLAFLTTNTAGIITAWNPGAERLFGYSTEETVGQDTKVLVPPERYDEIAMIRGKFRSGERLEDFATVRVTKDGKPIHVKIDTSPLHAPNGELIGSSAILRDVTEQRLAEELFGLAVEACPSGMMVVDRTGQIVLVNGEIENLFGYRREELIGQSVERLVPTDLRKRHAKLRMGFVKEPQCRRTGLGRELVGMRKDGSEFPVEIELNPIHIRDGLLILGVVVDISERKRTERLKDEFVSTVSHELRTPLTSITASLGLLTAGGAGRLPEPAARLVTIAHNNGQRLVRLVNDILDIEKIESGKMAFHIEAVDVRAIVDQAIEANHAYAQEFGVSVRLDAEFDRLRRARGPRSHGTDRHQSFIQRRQILSARRRSGHRHRAARRGRPHHRARSRSGHSG